MTYSFSRPLPDAKLRALSLGAGVQSTVLALMAEAGEVGPKPDCAIFSDTQWEPRAVYEHLDWLETQLSFPVHRVTQGDLRATVGATRPKGRFRVVDIPAFVRGEDGRPGGMVNRSCTRDYKIVPIQRKEREILGLRGRRAPTTPIVEQWIGISLDEVFRVKPSRDAWIQNRWPLIERGMNRRACLAWFAERYPGRPLAKSSCIGCPFHDDDEWRRIMADPVQRADAIEIDERLRSGDPQDFRLKGTLYLHRSCRPLAEIDWSEDLGPQADLFQNECEGMCGV